jgi:hypothetical protein
VKLFLIQLALLLTSAASAQGAPGECKPLGIVEGTKLWAGDCVSIDQRRSEARNEMRRLDARAPRRTQARRPVEPPLAEEKSWWGRGTD